MVYQKPREKMACKELLVILDQKVNRESKEQQQHLVQTAWTGKSDYLVLQDPKNHLDCPERQEKPVQAELLVIMGRPVNQ
jgi:5'-3' exonuclease